ncbi:MAG: rod shape-determining protein MreC [Brevinema sp.]
MRLFVIRYKTIITACILLSVSIFSMSLKNDMDRIYFKSFLFGRLFQVEKFVININTSLGDVFIRNKNIQELEQQLEEAEQQVLYYKELSRLYTYLKQENDHLRQTLQMKTQMYYSAHYSKVLFRDPSLLADYLIIDKGYNNGIRINMPVVSSSSETERLVLIGKTVEVGEEFARVRVITAKNFYAGVKSLDTGYTGMLRGQGSWNQYLSLDYIPIEANPTIGEQIVTSGESDIYPEGLYIGAIQGIGRNVMEEFFKTLYIQSDFKYSKITEVFVLEYDNNSPNLQNLGVTNGGF